MLKINYFISVSMYNIFYGLYNIHHIRVITKCIPAMLLMYKNIKNSISRKVLGSYLLGDLLLLPDNMTELGLLSFLIGHIIHINDISKRVIINKRVFISLFIITLFYLYYIVDHLGSMLIPVVMYIFILLIKSSYDLSNFHESSKILGSSLFLLSDSMLGVQLFVKPEWYGVGLQTISLTLYWIGLYLLYN